MIEDFKQFLKFYRAYKNGKEKMDNVKEFISKHKTEIACVVGGIVIYKVGYSRGFRDYRSAVNSVFNAMKRYGYNVVQLIEPGVTK